MRSDEILPHLSKIAVMKTTTGSVTVTTPHGPMTLHKPGLTYVVAATQSDVSALLASNTNIKTLLKQKLITLVF